MSTCESPKGQGKKIDFLTNLFDAQQTRLNPILDFSFHFNSQSLHENSCMLLQLVYA